MPIDNLFLVLPADVHFNTSTYQLVDRVSSLDRYREEATWRSGREGFGLLQT